MTYRSFSAALALVAMLFAALPCASFAGANDCCAKRPGCGDVSSTPCAQLAAAPCCGAPAAPSDTRELRLQLPLATPILAVDWRPEPLVRAPAHAAPAPDPLRPLRSVILRL